MKYDIYIGGPFFNKMQVEHIEKIENICREVGVSFFSPRLENLCPPDAPPDVKKKAFERNVKEVKNSTFLLACIDYFLPPGNELRIVSDTGELKSPPLNLPDVGTVFEMGCAHVSGTPVVGIIVEDLQKINLMLAETMLGFVFSYENLRELLQSKNSEGVFNFNQLKKWEKNII